jgi:hypothetical protein
LLQFRHEPGPVGVQLGVAVDQILHLIQDERDGVRYADLIRATSSCRPPKILYGKRPGKR